MSGPSANQADYALLKQIAETLAGLTWVSETDAPFDVALWEGRDLEQPNQNQKESDREEPDQEASGREQFDSLPSEAQLLKKAQLPPETPVEQLDLQTFLDPIIHPLYPPESPAVLEQFQVVKEILLQNLQEICVYRCGLGEIDIYILGRTPHRGWLVIHTTAVET